MANAKATSRSVKSAQLNMRELNFWFDGDESATPTPRGFDRLQITSITRVVTGQFTVIFKHPFQYAGAVGADIDPIAFCQIVEGVNRIASIEAVDYDRVTINTFKRDDGTLANAKVNVNVKGTDHRFNY